MASASPHVVDVTEQSFATDVVEVSKRIPVVIDFWAPWCGPCKTLGPVLEGLAESYGGAFRLCKVNVDENQALAGYFQVQSIPMVMAIYQQAPIDAFTGALPRQQVEQWLAGVFEAAGLPAPGAVEEEEAPTDPAAAEVWWSAKLGAKDDDQAARLALGRLKMARGAVEEAEALLNAIPAAAPEYNPAVATLALKDLVMEVGEAGGEAAVRARREESPDDLDAAYLAALADGASGRYAASVTALLALLQSGTPEQRERAKKKVQVVLQAAGRGDAEIEQLRRRLALLLY